MILVFGGAYQGKIDFVKEQFGLDSSDILEITEEAVGALEAPESIFQTECKAISGIDQFVLYCQRNGLNGPELVMSQQSLWNDKILILTDVSQGLVPMDPIERAWRENNGRTGIQLTKAADQVYRVFCGLAQKVK